MFVKVEIYIPEDHVEVLMDEINRKGLVQEGTYDYTFSTTKVRGHWRPLDGANPFLGQIGEISSEEEIKLEFRIREDCVDLLDLIIKEIHPYEEPVVNFIPLL